MESIPFLGRTWYVRGIDYYLRRAFAAFAGAMGLLVATSAEIGLFEVALTDGPVTRWVMGTILTLLLIVSLIRPGQAFIRGEKARRAGELLRPEHVPGVRERRPGGGVAMGVMTRAGSPVAGAMLVISVVIYYGWFLLIMYMLLRREPDQEYDARRRLQERHYWRQLAGLDDTTP